MKEFILRFWIEFLMGGIIAVLSFALKRISTAIKNERKEQRLLKEGVLALMHDRLYQLCHEHITEGTIEVDAMKNVEYIYKSYHALGGNGTGTELYERVTKLPIKSKED